MTGFDAVWQHAGEHVTELDRALVARLDIVPANEPNEVTYGVWPAPHALKRAIS